MEEGERPKEPLDEHAVELKSGYWSPYDSPSKMEIGTNTFTSTGVYGTPEFYDKETGRYDQSLFYLTETGEVYMLVNSGQRSIYETLKGKGDPNATQLCSLVGTNGKVTVTPDEPKRPSYLRPPDTFSFTSLAPILPPTPSPK